MIDVRKLRSDRIILREFEHSDAKRLAEIFSHPKFQGFHAIPPKGSAKEEIEKAAKEWVAMAIKLQEPNEKTKERENYKLAITLASDPDKLIGYVSLDGINQADGNYRDNGYFTDPDYQNHGYATEASLITLKAFFENTKYNEIYSTTHPMNVESRKVAEKLGFKKISDKCSVVVRGKVEPREKWVLNKEDFYAVLARWNEKRKK